MSITQQLDPIAIRPARASDAERLRWLAERDSAGVPAGRLLVAEVGGSIHAAVAVDSGEAIADPFRRTAELVALLRMRAAPERRRPPLRIVARSHPRLAEARRRRHATA
jgi:hypothetical protein